MLNLRTDSFINVKEFGLKGDGLTDETTLFEECVNSGKNLLIPADCHIVVSKPFTIKQNIMGQPNSSIKQITKRSNIFNLEKDGIVLGGLTLLGTGEGFEGESQEGSGTLIKSNAKNINIINCTFKDANYVGCFIDPIATSNVVENCHFINCWAEGMSVQSDFTKVKNCRFENCQYNGVVLRGANHVVVDSCEFIDGIMTDVALDIRANYDKTKHCENISITNNYFENVNICLSAYDNQDVINHKNLFIKGNTFNTKEDSELGVRIYHAIDVKVIDNTFNKAGTATSLLFSSCKNVQATGNTLKDGSLGIDCSSDELANISNNNIMNFGNIGIRTRTVTNTYTHNFVVEGNMLLNCNIGFKTEGNYNKSILFNGNSLTGCTKDVEITGAIDILVLTNNNFNIDRVLDIQAQRNTYIKSNNSTEKMVCSSSTRPKNATAGDMCFDTSVAKPIWYTGAKWVDATGANI